MNEYETRTSFIPQFEPEPEPPKPPKREPPPAPRSLKASIGAAPPEGLGCDPPSTDAGNVEGILSETAPATCRNCEKPLRRKRFLDRFCRARCASEYDQQTMRLEDLVESIDRELSRPKRPPFGDECRSWLHHRVHRLRELDETKRQLRGRHDS